MSRENTYPSDLPGPHNTGYQRHSPHRLTLCETVGAPDREGAPSSGEIVVRFSTPEARCWSSLALFWVPDGADVPAFDFAGSSIWAVLRLDSLRDPAPIANIRGTYAAPVPWPADSGLQGSIEEGITTGDDVLVTLYLDAARLPKGRLIAQSKFEATMRLTHEEWQRVISYAEISKLSGPTRLWQAGGE